MAALPCPLLRCMRLLALAVLMLGVLLKPVLTAHCEVSDLGTATTAPQLAAASDDASQESCCPGQACGECCNAGTVLSPALATPLLAVLAAHPAARLITPAVPAPRPVDTRPPITV